MKNIVYIGGGAVLFIVVIALLFSSSDSTSDTTTPDPTADDTTVESEVSTEEVDETDGMLDMQGYYLAPLDNYECTGGLTDGYRYLDADCVPTDSDDHVIRVGRGLDAIAIVWDGGRFIGNQVGLRNYDFTGGQRGVSVCEAFESEDLQLDAEHYVCIYDGEKGRTITIGIGKSFRVDEDAAYARGFEADLFIKKEGDDYNEQEYVTTLARFLNDSIVIDWSQYAPE